MLRISLSLSFSSFFWFWSFVFLFLHELAHFIEWATLTMAACNSFPVRIFHIPTAFNSFGSELWKESENSTKFLFIEVLGAIFFQYIGFIINLCYCCRFRCCCCCCCCTISGVHSVIQKGNKKKTFSCFCSYFPSSFFFFFCYLDSDLNEFFFTLMIGENFFLLLQ